MKNSSSPSFRSFQDLDVFESVLVAAKRVLKFLADQVSLLLVESDYTKRAVRISPHELECRLDHAPWLRSDSCLPCIVRPGAVTRPPFSTLIL